MKIRTLFSMGALTLMAGIAFAGFVQPAAVFVDEDNMNASGDQATARFSDNDVEFIGCGIRVLEDGMGGVISFGFCQAADSEEVFVVCTTFDAGLVDAMKAISDFAFIRFSWNENGDCTSIGSSTQSFYLPNGVQNGDHTHTYLTGKGKGHNNTEAQSGSSH